MRSVLQAAALVLLVAGAPALAQPPPVTPGEFAFCPANPVLAPAPSTELPSGKVVIDANHGVIRKHGVSHFTGNIVVTRDNERFWADMLSYERAAGILTASGHVRYANPKLSLEAPEGRYIFPSDRGTFWAGDYQVPAHHGQGHARRIETYGSSRTKLYGLTYSTCPPHDVSWRLHASRVILNNKTEIGYAHNAWISFKHVPLLWTPYLSFPLTGARKSGFLAPSLSQSSTNGLDIELPWYWNIAPNMDMTITPRLMSRRGLMMIDTYRWLFPGTTGQFHFEYLPHDRQTNTNRSLFQLQDSSQLASHWNVSTNLDRVSDPEYFDDFGNSLRQVAQTFQTRRITATYQVAFGSAFATLQDLAPIDPTLGHPYRKLPEIGLDFSWPNYRTGLTPAISNDFVRFNAPDRQGALRDNLTPSLKETFGGASWYVTPSLAFNAARYTLDAFNGQPAESITRTAPVFSLDSGLEFRRVLGRNDWLTQTLEPRAYYLYVPYRNQSNIPIFDTYLPPFDMEQLFTTNRFVGPDRLGDANQLSLALTSRFLNNASGEQLLSLGLGQILYFRNRRVTLPGQPVETSARSDYVGQLTANLGNRVFASVNLDYSPYSHRFDQGYVSLQYHPSTYQVLNLGYLYRQGELEQTNISFAWPILGHWSAVGRWNYSIRDHQTIENMLGLQYDSCCWRFRLVERRFVTLNGQGNSALYLELQLKGLGSLGNRMSDFLHDDIYGYGQNPQ